MRTQIDARAAFFVASCRDEDFCAPGAGNLNRRGADPAASAMNQERFTRGKSASFENVRPDREKCFGNSCGLFHRDPFRDGKNLARGRDAELRITSAWRERADGVSEFPLGDSFSDFLDGARNFEPQNRRGSRGRRVGAFSLHDIRAIDARVLNTNQDFAGFGSRTWTFDELHDFRMRRVDRCGSVSYGSSYHKSCV